MKITLITVYIYFNSLHQVIGTLERLKQQAGEIQDKSHAAEQSMHESDLVAAQYRPLAAACSRIYFTLERLADCHYLYQVYVVLGRWWCGTLNRVVWYF